MLAIGLSRGLGRGIRRCLLRRGRLLINAVLGEHVVQVGALGRVVDHFQMFLYLSTLQDCAFTCASVQPTWTMALSIVTSLRLSVACITTADEIIDSHYFDLS